MASAHAWRYVNVTIGRSDIITIVLTYVRPMQDNLQHFQVAIAAGANLADHRPARLPQVDNIAQQANSRATSSATSTHIPRAPLGPTAQSRNSHHGSGPLTDHASPSQLTILHVACAKQSIAMVEFVWQVCILVPHVYTQIQNI